MHFYPKTSDSSMKLAGFLLLVTLVILCSVMQELQAAVRPFRLFGESMQKAAPSFLQRRSQIVSHGGPVPGLLTTLLVSGPASIPQASVRQFAVCVHS